MYVGFGEDMVRDIPRMQRHLDTAYKVLFEIRIENVNIREKRCPRFEKFRILDPMGMGQLL